jgi:hypoxanthine phosphoribosyltransferase
MDYLKGKNPSEVRTAVLHYKTCSTCIPDYWAEKQDKWEWIIYPWAVYEDLTGFIIKVLTKPMTTGDIKKALMDNYSIRISKKDLLEILNDMQAERKLRKLKKWRRGSLWIS